MDFQDSLQQIFAEPCRKYPADLHGFAKIENLGSHTFPIKDGTFVEE